MKACINCGKDFEPNSGKQKFCSDKCKVSFARSSKKPPEIKVPKTILDKIIDDKKQAAWVKKIEKFCEEQNIVPEDLIESWIRNYFRKEVFLSKNINKEKKVIIPQAKVIKNVSNFWLENRNKKLGIKQD